MDPYTNISTNTTHLLWCGSHWVPAIKEPAPWSDEDDYAWHFHRVEDAIEYLKAP